MNQVAFHSKKYLKFPTPFCADFSFIRSIFIISILACFEIFNIEKYIWKHALKYIGPSLQVFKNFNEELNQYFSYL